MDQSGLTVDVNRAADAAVIEMRGSIRDSNDGSLEGAFTQARSQNVRDVILDFSQVTRLASPGVSLLVKQHALAKTAGQRLIAVGLDEVYRRIFALTNLDRAMIVSASLSEALATVKASTGAEQPAGSHNERGSSLDEAVVKQREAEAGFWAAPISRIQVPEMPKEAVNVNVGGRRVVGPVLGFGPLWEKTYEVSFDAAQVTPAAAIEALKERFPSFQPPENRFYASAGGIKPGEVVLINATSVGLPVYTGVVVSYADDECFTFMTPEGHPESGWVTFQAFAADGLTTCRIQGLARANDPVYEIAFRVHGSTVQERIWKHVLKSLNEYLGQNGPVKMRKVCVDGTFQWSQVGNIRHNAQIWSLLYLPLLPLRRRK